MDETEERKPRTQTQPDRGSGGIPPRPTAVGTSDLVMVIFIQDNH